MDSQTTNNNKEHIKTKENKAKSHNSDQDWSSVVLDPEPPEGFTLTSLSLTDAEYERICTEQEIDKEYGHVRNIPFKAKKPLDKVFYLYYVDTGRINRVSKAAFLKAEGKIVTLPDMTRFRIIGQPNKQIVKRIRARFCGEGAFSSFRKTISDLVRGIKFAKDTLINIGSALNKFDEIKEACQNQFFLLLDAISLIVDLADSISRGFNITSLVKIFLSAARVIYQVPGCIGFLAESGADAFAMGVASLFLPKRIVEIFRNMSLFSSAKFLDDTSYFHTFIGYVQELFEFLLAKIPNGFPGVEKLKDYISNFNFGEHHVIIDKMEKSLAQYRKDKNLLTSASFRNSCKELLDQANSNKSLVEWSKRSAVVRGLIEDFTNICKNFRSFEEATRIEPACFVFEGPPGCLKSVTMNSVIKIIGKSSYAHHIKAMSDGKDWYDSYNNESIFYMDDVGQQGISQYRTIINLVSPVKLPLDCARAENKDTKFFTSEIVLLTTNNFVNLHGLTKQDCISDIHALWRRGYVFDFTDTIRLGNALRGKVQFKYFDTNKACFVSAFPKDFVDHCEEKNLIVESCFEFTNNADMKHFYLWCADIIIGMSNLKKSQYYDNTISESELEGLRARLNFCAEVESPFATFTSEISSVITWWRDSVMSWVSSSWDFIAEIIKGLLDCFGCESKFPFSHAGAESGKVKESPSTAIALVKIFVLNVFMGFLFYWVTSFFVGLAVGSYDSESEEDTMRIFFNDNKEPNLGSVIESVSKQMFQGSLIYDGLPVDFHCLISGHLVILPSHAVINDKDLYLVVYKNKKLNHRIYDHIPVKKVFIDRLSDVAVLSLPTNIPTPMRSLAAAFNTKRGVNRYLLNCFGSVPLSKVVHPHSDASHVYTFVVNGEEVFRNKFDLKKDYSYSVRGNGLCGTLVVDKVSGIKGMHVAGDADNGVGVAMAWSAELLNTLHDMCKNDNRFLLNVEMSDRDLQDFSGMKLDQDFHSSVPKKSNFVPSDLYNAFPVDRVPVDMTIYGDMTVKDISKKAYAPVRYAPPEDIKFAERVCSYYVTAYSSISDEVVIKGNELLAGLNKDSSNGMGCLKDKKDYIDFERGVCRPNFTEELKSLEEAIVDGTVDITQVIWKETLKDELRDKSKTYPRSFRISRLHIMFLTKRYFGHFVANIMRDRNFNQIMIGCNPVKDWPMVYAKLASAKGVWAADFSKWDGSMLPQVQCAANDLILSKFEGTERERKIASFLLYNLPFCLVSVADDTYLTTHSMPSGSYLTAIMNSFVNRFYTAMWYHHAVRQSGMIPSPAEFAIDLADYIYGDDRLNAVFSKHNALNAISMKNYMERLGLKITTSKKAEVTREFESIRDVTFLKRYFRYHSALGRVVCPLDLATLKSGLSWVDRTKESDTVLRDKMHAFQREAFLHEDEYKPLVDHLEQVCRDRQIPFDKLSHEYLMNLYVDEPENFVSLSWGGSKYL